MRYCSGPDVPASQKPPAPAPSASESDSRPAAIVIDGKDTPAAGDESALDDPASFVRVPDELICKLKPLVVRVSPKIPVIDMGAAPPAPAPGGGESVTSGTENFKKFRKVRE